VTLPGRGGKLDTWIGELGSPARTLVVSAASGALYAPPGYMIFVRDQSLVAQALDLGRLRLTGEPARIGDAPEDLTILGTTPASASENGILVYPTNAPTLRRMTWFARDAPTRSLPQTTTPRRDQAASRRASHIHLTRRSPSAR